MPISTETPIGRIAAEHPLATRVFARHRLDYCCGGDRPLGAACAARGVDLELVLRELEREIENAVADDTAPDRREESSPAEIIAHIVAAYHEPLREELPRLRAMARKVAAVHGDKCPDTLPALSATVAALEADLEKHMVEEEEVVFPRILTEQREAAVARFADLEHDHAEAGAALERIRELTGDYRVPAEACATWRALWHGLEDLERMMHEHVHLENNVLFPRVSAG